MGPIGRREVLRWAAGVSRRDVTRLDDLRDGTVLLEVRPRARLPSSSSMDRWPPDPGAAQEGSPGGKGTAGGAASRGGWLGGLTASTRCRGADHGEHLARQPRAAEGAMEAAAADRNVSRLRAILAAWHF